MSLISKATAEKREIRDLRQAHSQQAPDGVATLGEFAGFVRCAVIIRSEQSADVNNAEVWSANQEGKITIRSVADGNAVQQSVFIPAVPGTHVNAMVQVNTELWCAYADGYVRAYCLANRTKVFEKKRHSGAICSIATDGEFVFTGSEDFQIIMWESLNKRLVSHFTGHANHVKSLTVHNGKLLSAGSDGVIRCWSIRDQSEVISSPFPVRLNRGGISGLHIMDGFLFACCAHEVALLRLENGSVAHSIAADAGTSILTMTVCEATVTLWFSLSDGSVKVYDLFNYEQVGPISAHSSTVVPACIPVARSTVNRIQVLTNQGLVLFTASSDCLVPEYDAFRASFVKLHDEINTRRASLATNAQEILKFKSQLRALKRYDERQRALASKIMSTHSQIALTTRFAGLNIDFLVARRNFVKREAAARALSHHHSMRLAFRAFATWMRSVLLTRTTKITKGVEDAVRRSTDANLIRNAVTVSICALTIQREAARTAAAANALAASRDQASRKSAYSRWFEFAQARKSSGSVINIISASATRSNSLRLKAQAWTTLVVGSESLRQQRLQTEAAVAICGESEKSVALRMLDAWLRWTRRNKLCGRKVRLGTALDSRLCEHRTRASLIALARHAREVQISRLRESTKATAENNQQLAAVLDDPDLLTESELDASIREIQAKLDDVTTRTEVIKTRLTQIDALIAKLNPEATEQPAFDAALDELKSIPLLRLRKDASIVCNNIGSFDNVKAKLLQIIQVYGTDIVAAKQRWSDDRSSTSDEAKQRLALAIVALRGAIASWEAVDRSTSGTWDRSAAEFVVTDNAWIKELVKAHFEVEKNRPPTPPAEKKAITPKADQQTRTGTGQSEKARGTSPKTTKAGAASGGSPQKTKPADKAAAKPAEKQDSKAAAKPGSKSPKPTEKSDKPATKPAAKPVDKPATKPANKSPAAKPAPSKPAAK